MSTYLFINLGAIFLPLLFSFHPRLKFYKQWKAILPAIIIPAVFFIAWDISFTKLKVWGFNPEHLIGINILGLPLEEWLFFGAIPYACLFTYEALKKLNVKSLPSSYSFLTSILLIFSFLFIGFIYSGKLYTATTFLLTSLFLAIHTFAIKTNYQGIFYIAYSVVYAFPFLVVNGLLTGSGLTEPIVWYNNEENLNIRLITIPIEDFVYGFFLFLFNVTVYEYFVERHSS